MFSWIGYDIDTHFGIISTSDSGIEKCPLAMNQVCVNLEVSLFLHVKMLASIVGSQFPWAPVAKILLNCDS